MFSFGIGEALGGLFGLGGSAAQAAMNMKIAQKQMDFQERMSNTQYQRTMKDMYAAGLNPILAAKMGGAGTPPGAAIPVGSNLAQGAITGAKAWQQMKILKSQAEEAYNRAGSAGQLWKKLENENILLKTRIPAALTMEDFDKSPLGQKAIKAKRALSPIGDLPLSPIRIPGLTR